MADIDKIRTKVLEQFANGGKSKRTPDKESTAADSRPGATMDDSLVGQMLEHQQGTSAVDAEALKIKRQRIKETLNKPLLHSLFRSM